MRVTHPLRYASIASAMYLLFALTSVAFAQVAGFLPRGEFPMTDFDNASVSLDEITVGGPPRDGIPAIDSPDFISMETAAEWLSDEEPVVSLAIGNKARAYPLQILIYHEIVNDTLANTPVSVTFCPLCNASIVFDRRVAGEVLDFGTTGRLRNSDLIMYDRQSESWWQQFTGRGIIGKHNEVKLVQLPSQIVAFSTFRDAYPEGEVLSRKTGHTRSYGSNPYAGYDHIDNSPFLYNGPEDPRLRPMERVLSVPGSGASLLIPLTSLEDQPVLNLTADDQAVVVLAATTVLSALDQHKIAASRSVPAASAYSSKVGDRSLRFRFEQKRVFDEETNSEWNAFGQAVSGPLKGQSLRQLDSGVHFAFAWLAFEPSAQIYRLP